MTQLSIFLILMSFLIFGFILGFISVGFIQEIIDERNGV